MSLCHLHTSYCWAASWTVPSTDPRSSICKQLSESNILSLYCFSFGRQKKKTRRNHVRFSAPFEGTSWQIYVATVQRLFLINLHVCVVQHHMYDYTESISVHLYNTRSINLKSSITNSLIGVKNWLAWNFQGLFSFISVQRKPDVRQSPVNWVVLGNWLKSIPLPQSTRQRPWVSTLHQIFRHIRIRASS